jgi:murein DD-endopeptidase MepM/ murein hydrolase activator NlpD
MTQTLTRSVLALFATSALALSANAAAASSSMRAAPAVLRDGADAPQLILAATHHRKHHAATKASTHKASSHRRGHGRGRHAVVQPIADEESVTGAPGANGHIAEVATGGEGYTVKKGDNLQKIADQLGVEVAELKKLNKIKGTSIRAGQVLKTPGSTSKAYVAARGDTLAGVAKRFGVSEKALKAENGLGRRASALKSGQHLKLPDGYRDHGVPKAEGPRLRGRVGASVPAEEMPVAGSVSGRVVEIPGPPRTYKVRRGDTLDKVADKLGVSVAQLKKQNHLRSSHIHPGQTLKAGPGGPVKAYVVGPGDTTYSIARRFGVSIEALRAANGMGRRGTIHTGQKLRLPAGFRDHGPSVSAAPLAFPSRPPPSTPEGGQPQPGAPPATARPYTPPPVTNGPPLPPASASAPTDAQVSEMGRGKFAWPLRGEVLSDFGPKTAGQRNDGLNIQANAGDAVHAAAAGDVVYAGDQVPGFGNLVLVKHADGWVTAYGHLSKIEVKMQQKVSQGQEIGQAGSTGGVAEPQLHFEVRYAPNPAERARPIDPKLVLPH